MRIPLITTALSCLVASSPVIPRAAGGITDSIPANENDYAIRDSTPLMSKNGPMHVLMPRHHPDHDASHLDHLLPERSKSLFFAQTEFGRHINPESRYLSAYTSFKYDAVVLDHSAHLAATVSGKSITIDFSSPHAFAVAKESWIRADSPFIFVTCSGSSDGHFVYYTVTESKCEDQCMSCDFTVEVSEFEDVVEGFNLEFGHVKHIARRQATTSQPHSPSSTFDAALDDSIGYVVWSPQTFAADLRQFAEGLQDTNFDHYQDQNVDASGLWNTNDGTVKTEITLPVSPEDFFLTFGEAGTLGRRGTNSGTLSAIAAAVGKIVGSAANVLNDIKNKAIEIKDALFAAVKELVSYVDGTPKSLSKNYKYSFPDPDNPGYVAQDTFKNPTTGNARNAIKLYDKSYEKGKITLYCLDCGLDASLEITGTLAYKLGSGVQQARLNMDGGFMASAYLGLDASFDINEKSNNRLFEVGIAGIVVPKFLTIGPIATVDITTSYFLSARAAVLAGATVEITGLQATIDIVNPLNNRSPNVKVDIKPTFTADGQISAGFTFGVPIGVAVGLSIADGKASAKASLVVEPSVGVTASASVSINQTGVAPDGGSACGGLSLGYYLQNSIYAQAEANLLSLKYASEKKRIVEDSKTTLATRCLDPPAQAPQNSQVVAYSDVRQAAAPLEPPSQNMGFVPDDEHVGELYVVPKAVQNIASLVPANTSAPTNLSPADPSVPGFNYTIIGDSANQYKLVTTQEGNLGVQPASAITEGNAIFRVIGNVVIGDSIGRALVYYADEAAQYNVSRLRMVTDDKVPLSSKAIGLATVRVEDGTLPSGLPKVIMVAVNSVGQYYWTAVCSYSDASPSKIFVVSDLSGLATLQSAATNVNVTGPNVSRCEMISLVDLYAVV